jgi:hypothetical protein
MQCTNAAEEFDQVIHTSIEIQTAKKNPYFLPKGPTRTLDEHWNRHRQSEEAELAEYLCNIRHQQHPTEPWS